MKTKYKFNADFKGWKKGAILEEYEYNRLPQELKKYAEKVEEKPVVKTTFKPKPTIIKKDEDTNLNNF